MPTARRPAPRSSGHAGPQRLQIQLGAEGLPVGELVYAQQGRRVYSQFAYAPSWLAHAQGFEISPDLPLLPGYQVRKASNTGDSVFHFALADTAPDAWGRRVIERAHAKARRNNPQLGPLTELDYLCAVDDHSRIGALRLQQAGTYLQTVEEGRRRTPPLVELGRLLAASRAVETEQDTAEDLAYLQGRGTSLGGMRPKCTLQDEQGQLAIGKFPSVSDSVNVTRAEVLALRLAALAVLLSQSTHFELSRAQATQTVAEVLGAVRQWHQVGSQPEVGLTSAELAAFEDAFEHSQTQAARALAGR